MADHANSSKHLPLPEDAAAETERWIAGLMDGESTESTANIRSELQEHMMDKASVVRTEDSMSEMLALLGPLRERYARARVGDRSKIFNTELVEHMELGYLIDMAEALVVSAKARKESRGGHYREDYQKRDDTEWLKHSFITRTPDGGTSLDYKPVTMGRYEPVERKY